MLYYYLTKEQWNDIPAGYKLENADTDGNKACFECFLNPYGDGGTTLCIEHKHFEIVETDSSGHVTPAEKKKQAVKRMKQIGIYPETIKQFENDDLVSQSLPPVGACFWIEGEQLERVKQFEREYNSLVYFVIHSYTNIGEMDSYLYVSDYPAEWSLDNDDIENGQSCCFVYNYDDPMLSEIGAVGIELTPAQGLRRSW